MNKADDRSICLLSKKEAIENYSKNNYSKWHGINEVSELAYMRIQNNLFEPKIISDFSFTKQDSVFTVGSCFARGLEKSLLNDGINVLSVTDIFNSNDISVDGATAMGYMNKYNTAAILNEFKCAFNNDFQNGENFVEISDGIYCDSNTNPTITYNSFDKTLERRKQLISIFKQVEKCKLLTITLGLIEVWHDKELNLDFNVTPPNKLLIKYPDRFELKVTGFEENLKNLEELYELLKINGRDDLEIIVTVSPVPLQATFSGRDIVVANTLSKSLLRTVADTWASRHTNVHYFPSYEIVMCSNQKLVWEDDRRHVKGVVAQYIMEIFKQYYLEDYSGWKIKIPKFTKFISNHIY